MELTRRFRKQLEWHFYNYKAELALYSERLAKLNDRRNDIMDSMASVNYAAVGGRGGSCSDTTASRAMRLESLDRMFDNRKDWFCVVRNTFNHFMFEHEATIMLDLYVNGKKRSDVLKTINESTFWYWRDRWLGVALMWAKKFDLI